MCFVYIPWPRTIKQLNPDHLSFMWRPEPMQARSHTMPARGSFWPLWSDRRLYKVTMHWLHKFEANPADHQAVMWFFAIGPPGWGREVRSSAPPLSFTLSANHSLPAIPMRSKNRCWPGKLKILLKGRWGFLSRSSLKDFKKTQWCGMRKRLSDVELGKSDNMTQFCRSYPNHPMPVLFVHHTSSPTSLLLPYSPYRHLTTSSTVL